MAKEKWGVERKMETTLGLESRVQEFGMPRG